MISEIVHSIRSPLGEEWHLRKQTWAGNDEEGKTLSIVSGLHGDDLNSLYLAGRLAAFLETVEQGREAGIALAGKIRLFPAANVPALSSGERLWPFDHLDPDLAFPGSPRGEPAEQACNAILRHTRESDLALLIDHPEPLYEHLPQIRTWSPDRKIRKLAGPLGIGLLKSLAATPASPLQLLHRWREIGISALALSFGKPGILDTAAADRLLPCIIRFMLNNEILSGTQDEAAANEVLVFEDTELSPVISGQAGLFLPAAPIGRSVKSGDVVGELRDLFTGERREEYRAPVDGTIISARRHPVVHEMETVLWLLPEKRKKWYWPF